MRALFWEGLVLGLLVGVGLMWTGPWLMEQLAYWRAPVVDLHPAVAVYSPTMWLTNGDTFEWNDVRLLLNAHAADKGYAFRLARVPAGAQIEFALESFTTPDGFPFNPRTTKAFFLSIEADTPQGRGRWSGRLD
jgi:hypothetical protein